MISRRQPLLAQHSARAVAGFVLAAVSPWLSGPVFGSAAAEPVASAILLLVALLPAMRLTDKYRHKYPQRYDTYLIASHLKAAIVMAVALFALRVVFGPFLPEAVAVWPAFVVFVAADYLVSLPRIQAPPAHGQALAGATPAAAAAKPEVANVVDTGAVLRGLEGKVDGDLKKFLSEQLPQGTGARSEVIAFDDVDDPAAASETRDAALLVIRTRLNDVRRLNLLLGYCAEHTAMGGYVSVRYTPLEYTVAELRRRWPGWLYRPAYLLHFLRKRVLPKTPFIERWYFTPALSWIDNIFWNATKRRDRVLPKAEVWGRLAFWGLEVVAESEGDAERLVLARRTSPPPANRRPSFFALVGLEKVGLDGKLMRTHKVRSMYPFSEYLQKRLYDTSGLTQTGKFKNDFRLTEYGTLIRRHWIDELPGIYDWLHGEIKLVGMRATSPQYLSTYPKELYDLYIQVKPGLVPPIFDEKTGGFDAIVRTEITYLRRYVAAPMRTDIAYFWYTFRDIVFRRVRSN